MNSTAVWGFVGGVIRSLLAAAAGYLLKEGLLDAESVEKFVAAIGIVGAVAWSAINKYVLHKEIGNIEPAK